MSKLIAYILQVLGVFGIPLECNYGVPGNKKGKKLIPDPNKAGSAEYNSYHLFIILQTAEGRINIFPTFSLF